MKRYAEVKRKVLELGMEGVHRGRELRKDVWETGLTWRDIAQMRSEGHGEMLVRLLGFQPNPYSELCCEKEKELIGSGGAEGVGKKTTFYNGYWCASCRRAYFEQGDGTPHIVYTKTGTRDIEKIMKARGKEWE